MKAHPQVPGALSQLRPMYKRNPAAPKTGHIHVAMIAPEVSPFAKTGGLGETLGALPKALAKLGIHLSLIMPAYRQVLHGGFKLDNTRKNLTTIVSHREQAELLKYTIAENVTIYFIAADRYFDREYMYGTPEGDFPDNAERFILFSRAALEALRSHPPQIVQAHDWQAALAIAFLKAQPELYPELESTRTIMTVHNLGYQGIYWSLDWHLLNLSLNYFTPSYLEFHGKINFLKAGLVFADAITTVSPTYAQEIQTSAHGFGLDGVFRERAGSLTGILNGVDYAVWNPGTDAYIIQNYSPENKLQGKLACKIGLQKLLNLPDKPNMPLIGMVSRLSSQKGLDLLQKALPNIMQRDLQLVVLGTGDRVYQDWLSTLPGLYPDKVAVRIEFSEELAHKIIAGADMLLMPSLYEPGGLTQLYAMKYGTIPLVRATGGLKDSVQPYDPDKGTGNGFVFGPYEPTAFLETLDLALALFRDRAAWTRLMNTDMAADFSWDHSAQKYLELYHSLL